MLIEKRVLVITHMLLTITTKDIALVLTISLMMLQTQILYYNKIIFLAPYLKNYSVVTKLLILIIANIILGWKVEPSLTFKQDSIKAINSQYD